MKLPIGIQTFSEIIEGGYLYVDKTEYIHELLNGSKYYFLSRPRRFGKSLLLSTMKSIYEGRKDLFKGLWIENEWNWEQQNPVIHFKFSSIDYQNKGLETAINDELDKLAQDFHISLVEKFPKSKFEELIKKLYEKEGKVVILIDEYDKPIIDYLDKNEQAENHRYILKTFYSILKDADLFIELVFITGVSQFARTSIFSDLNNLTNLSIHRKSMKLLGITEAELLHYFGKSIAEIANEEGMTSADLLTKIKYWYNGYSWNGKDKLCNPFSLLCYFDDRTFRNYWFSSGTPTFLVNLMKQQKIHKIENITMSDIALSSYNTSNINPYTLLFQTGYLTIKSKPFDGMYRLAYPNYEVKVALEEYLLNAYANDTLEQGRTRALDIAQAFEKGDIESVINFINATFATIPYQLWQKENEAFYHAIVHLTLSLMGVYIQSEINTSKGRLDAKIMTDKAIYIVEFKLGKTAEEAIEQIENRGYFNEYQNDERQRIGIGINFSIENKAVDKWIVKEF